MVIPATKLPKNPCRANPMANTTPANIHNIEETSNPIVPAAIRTTMNCNTKEAMDLKNPEISGSRFTRSINRMSPLVIFFTIHSPTINIMMESKSRGANAVNHLVN